MTKVTRVITAARIGSSVAKADSPRFTVCASLRVRGLGLAKCANSLQILQILCKFLAGSFSAVSKRKKLKVRQNPF